MIWKKWQWRMLTAPKELLRAGAIMQARGLINSQAIQHNMDWVGRIGSNVSSTPMMNRSFPALSI